MPSITQTAQIEWLRKEVICLKNNKPCGCSEQSGECTCTVNIEGQVTVNSNVAVENTVKLAEPKLITTPINYLVNGKCTNATLVTSIENNNVTASYFLIKGAKQDLSTIPVYQEGICCCAPTSSGTGAIGVIEPVWTSAYPSQLYVDYYQNPQNTNRIIKIVATQGQTTGGQAAEKGLIFSNSTLRRFVITFGYINIPLSVTVTAKIINSVTGVVSFTQNFTRANHGGTGIGEYYVDFPLLTTANDQLKITIPTFQSLNGADVIPETVYFYPV